MKKPHQSLLLGVPNALVLAVFIPFAATLLYGFLCFPSAPYRLHAESYADKNGHSRTAEEFQAYRRWRRLVSVSGTAWALLCVGAAARYYSLTGSFRRQPQAERSTPTQPAA